MRWMGMHARSAPVAQASLSAAAAAAGVAFGATWLGLGWTYDVSVDGASFQLPSEFAFGLLVAALMGLAATLAGTEGRARTGALGLTIGGGAIFGSALWTLLVWAPSGAPAGQLELLKDASRLGFALLALSLPLALPGGVRDLARGVTFALGAMLVPVVLFPQHVESAGLNDVHTTLPMLLFFLQAGLALSGAGGAAGGRGWGRKRAAAEPEVSFLRASLGKPRKARKPKLTHEPLQHAAPPSGPSGPRRPSAPLPSAERAKAKPWFFQF
jgi:hypothetical protein